MNGNQQSNNYMSEYNIDNPAKITEKEKQEILSDYRLAHESRQASVIGRKEVLTGKAKFGIMGDGKELAQIAMAKMFQNGDWRSGYYRDQTFAMATGITTLEELFSQLYGDTNPSFNPSNGGRMMNNHFSTHSLDKNGNWKDLTQQKTPVPTFPLPRVKCPECWVWQWLPKFINTIPIHRWQKVFRTMEMKLSSEP